MSENARDNSISKSVTARRTLVLLLLLSLVAHGALYFASSFSKTEKLVLTRVNKQHNQYGKKKHLKIAIISGFVSSSAGHLPARVSLLDHIVNKACYANLWHYDYIFNTTNGFSSDELKEHHWLRYGHWNKIHHIRAALNHYDWILYADIDYVFKDMTRPLESFLYEFELYGKHPHVFVPRDGELGPYTFSNFAFMLRNSEFSYKLLDHWMDFAMGLCEKGNCVTTPGKYGWWDSDQPGFWYALMKTHNEFFPNKWVVTQFCNKTSGFIRTDIGAHMGLKKYFAGNKAVVGNYGEDLSKVPRDQPIIWSTSRKESRTGLGVNLNWGRFEDAAPWAFALHVKDKEKWPADMTRELEICKQDHGCYARYDFGGHLQIGCSQNATNNRRGK